MAARSNHEKDKRQYGKKNLKFEVGECIIEEHDTKSVEIYNVKTRLNESNILGAKSCIDGAGLGLFIRAPMEVSSPSDVRM